jgi:hypothetical protein
VDCERGDDADCNNLGLSLRSTVDGARAMQIWLQQKSPKLNSSSQPLQLLVQDEVCGGGRSTVVDRLVTSVVVHAKTNEVTVALWPLPTVTRDGQEVMYTCEGYPPTPITVRLPGKLGPRKVVNASEYPSVPLTRWVPMTGPPPTVVVPS